MVCATCKTDIPISASHCPACGSASPEGTEETQIFLDVPSDDNDATQLFDHGVSKRDDDATQMFVEGDADLTQATPEPRGWSKPFTPSDAAAYGKASLVPGSVLGGRYEILKTLGEGGMGAVFQARDAEVDRIVALKVIRPELAGNAEILRRFRQELVLAQQITHRNAVRIYDLAVADGVRFISMEFIEGQELKHVLDKRGKVPYKEAAEIMLQVCYGLAAAHRQGIVHRDLKPQNIMIDKQGRVAVMDFGLAGSMETAALLAQAGPAAAPSVLSSTTETAASLTRVGSLLGTPRYMSPEQARAQKIDLRSDLFTVGLILWELTVGKMPTKNEGLTELLVERGKKQIPPPLEADPQMPRPLSDIVSRCVQLDPAARYQTIAALIHDLEIWLGVTKKQTASWKMLSAVAMLIVLLAGSLIYSYRSRPLAGTHAPVKILISDFSNQTGNPVLDGTLEPELSTALEGASFITSYNRGTARKTLAKLSGSTKLDENSARLIAQREGVGVVVTGTIVKNGSRYVVSAEATDARTSKVIDKDSATAATPNDLNKAVVRIAAGFRKALGDATPKSAQLAAAETFSSQSLEASQQYALAQELQWQGKWDAALQAYARSTELDPGLGRAYAGMAVILANTGRKQDAEKNFKLALSKIDRMTDREQYRTRGAYYLMERDYDKAIEQYKALAKQFPADSAGIGNLALAEFYARNMAGAVEDERKVVALYPDNVLFLNNYGLFAMYAGDFDTAIRESERLIQLNPGFEKAYICLAISQLAKGDGAAAAETYKKVAPLSAWGASASAAGLADIALYQGRPDEALAILDPAVKADLAAKDASRAAAKYIMQAQAWLRKGQSAKAIAAAELAANGSTDESLLYPAAMIFLDAGKADKAMELSQKLSQRLEPDPGAYGKLIEAEAQMNRRDYRNAVRTFQEAQKIADTWLGRLGLGRAYLEAAAFPDAETELDACVKRRGEASSVFLDDEPSWRYYAPVDYYLGRAHEGLQSPGAAEAYRSYLKGREKSVNDPLAADAKKRLRSLEASGSASH
jgi:serine/threonine protein kinase/tetratricopeptide (TPR) repeat protein